MIMKGVQPNATRLTFHEKMNPRVQPQHRANIVSMMTAKPSVLTPLRVYTSLARTDVMTPAELSLISNQPTLFLRIAVYKEFLTFKVMFSPMTPNKNL